MVRFVLKFAEGQDAFLNRGEFFSLKGETFTPLNEWLRQYTPSEIFPLFDLSSASGQEASFTERDLDLNRFFCVVLEADKGEVEARLSELSRLHFLEEAYVEGLTEPAQE